jgi:T4 beta protein
VALHGNGVCFRLLPEDIVNASGATLEWLSRRMKDLNVASASTSLLLDFGKLRAIGSEDIVLASVGLLRAAEKLGMLFQKVTISGSSLVDYVNEVAEEHGQGAIVREELGIWLRTSALYGWQKSLRFSDYGIVRPGHVDKVPAPDANGKIRYTAGRQTHYFRGCSKKKIAPAVQYTAIAKRVVDSPHYKGRTYSEGDLFLDRVALHGRLSPDMGEWIRMDMNHHLVYTARQIRAILRQIAQQEKPIEVLENFADAF